MEPSCKRVVSHTTGTAARQGAEAPIPLCPCHGSRVGGRELGRVVKRSGRQPSTPWSRRRSRARRGRLGPVSVCVVMRCAACVARSDGLGPRRVAPGSCCCSCFAARSAAASKGRIAGLPPDVSATPVWTRPAGGARGLTEDALASKRPRALRWLHALRPRSPTASPRRRR